MSHDFEPRSYWERRLETNPNIHGVGYLDLGLAYNQWMYRVRGAVFDSCVRRAHLDLPNARVLDVGSGTGFYLDRWLRLGVRDLHGADLTAVATRLLRKRFPRVPIHTTDIGSDDALREVPLAPGSLDAVSCIDVLFHVVDDARYETALQNIARLLRPGGYLLLSENCVHGREIRLEHHVSRTLHDVMEMLSAAGLELVSRQPMLYLMNAPVDASTERLARWERWMLRMTSREMLGWLTGAILYPLERLLVRRRDESPTTELLLCRRFGTGPDSTGPTGE